MDSSDITKTVESQRRFFEQGGTRDVSARIRQLNLLKDLVKTNEQAIFEAIGLDLGKSPLEAYVGEVAVLTTEIDYTVKRLPSWVRPDKVKTPFFHFPATSYIYPEPLGVVLIIGPWNYPFQLALTPLIGAIAAGNCSIIKPSELAPNTSGLIARLVGENFDPRVAAVIDGGVETSQELLSQRFDHIFFTGGTSVGRIIARAAAERLIPYTLELGGKSPCFVDRNVDLECAARRITWGKFFNAGQSCTAPDYLLIDTAVKTRFLELAKGYVKKFYGDDPRQSPDFARIVNTNHFDRLAELLAEGDVVLGGATDRDDKYIAPTIIDSVSPNHKIMQSEIFGPILPVIEYDDLRKAIGIVNSMPKPLALYIFSLNREFQGRILAETSSGGVTVNDVFMHGTTQTLPFGGVGDSGIGRYHGKASFDTFSNMKAVIRKGFRFDLDVRYPPYEGKLSRFRKLVKYLG
jgi:acyl-CoA reductase-like NAD-dependent aldehyde dehydrogenase